MRTFKFDGGIHPMHANHEGKSPTREMPIQDFISDTMCIPMAMHLGAPSEPCVAAGDHVKLGQIIGTPVGGLGLPVHASVSGEVISVEKKMYTGGAPVMCVTIKNDFQDEWVEGISGLGNVESADPAAIIPAVKNAGVCGMGGASFPSHVKMAVPEGKRCDVIIINGAECETFLTADDRLMRETPNRVVDGLRAVMRALNVENGVIAIENNKPEAIAAIEKAASGREGVEVVRLKTKYPQGGEKQLIKAVTGREVPSGKLPLDANAIVFNVATACAIADAVTDGIPLISRITTVTGCVKTPKNLKLRIGTIVADAVGECGGYSEDIGKLVLGGGMTGLAVPDDDVPLAKASGGIVAYSVKDAPHTDEGPCIRCGRCVEACPMRLNPYRLKNLCDSNELDRAKDENALDCIVCGCCSYVCPAERFITASIKNGKDKIMAAARARAEAEKAKAAAETAKGGNK